MGTGTADKMRVLVVDDLREVTGLLKVFFSKDFDITTAHDGRGALDLMQSGYCPDAVVTDLRMPGMDGYTLINELRKNETTCSIPIIVFSVVDRKKAIENLAGHNISGFISKQTLSGDLLKKLKLLLTNVAIRTAQS